MDTKGKGCKGGRCYVGMNLSEYMMARGWARPGVNKCICPFHGDRTPSAILNPNSIYCFSCSMLYTLWDFQQGFGVFLDRVSEEDSSYLNSIKGKSSYIYNQVLFWYPFTVRGL